MIDHVPIGPGTLCYPCAKQWWRNQCRLVDESITGPRISIGKWEEGQVGGLVRDKAGGAADYLYMKPQVSRMGE